MAQGGFTVNYPHKLDELACHVSHIIGHALDEGFELVEATSQAEQAWVDKTVELSRQSAAFEQICTPGYYNNEGQPSRRAAQDSSYGKGSIRFFELLEEWRVEGRLDRLDLKWPTQDQRR
jgi:cyclohexanone monooxygenase